MKSNELQDYCIISLPYGDKGQRTAAAPAASSAPSESGLLEDQPPEIQETTTAPAGAKRHSATPAKRRPTARATKGRPPQGRHTAASTKGHPASTKTRRIMLLNDLYTIDHIEACTATLRLNTAHPIFKGHFPDRPVLPGACQLQMIRELLSHITTKTCRLQKATAIKFITPIDPRHDPTIRLDLQYDEVQNAVFRVTATIQAGEAVCLKFNGTFQVE